MNKRHIHIASIFIFVLALSFFAVLIYDNYLQTQLDLHNPNNISNYWDIGIYEFDPETILASLEGNNSTNFIELTEEPPEINKMTNPEIVWTQEDLLNIAIAIGKFVWGESANLEDWRIYYMFFEGNCNNPYELDFATIVFFEERGNKYITYLVEINPYLGVIRLGDGETYPKPILWKWKSVDLFASKIFAEKALQIAGEDAKTQFQFEKQCGATISSPQNNDVENWHLKIFSASDFLSYTVNMKTGEYSFQNLDE